jgi:hypothetical protein
MQDVRIRVGSTLLLSIATFISIPGAIAALVWWLAAGGLSTVRSSRYALIFIGIAGLVSFLVELSGGDGLSYFIRMTVILLIAFWAFAHQTPGEFMDLAVWAGGNTRGFDLGLVAEATLQAINAIRDDIDRIRVALTLKGKRTGIRGLLPAASVLIVTQLSRAEDQADLLVVRGYRRGGSWCPKFPENTRDIAGGIGAILVLLVAFIPIRDIFILLL